MEKLLPLGFTGGKGVRGEGGEEIDFRAHDNRNIIGEYITKVKYPYVTAEPLA
jgi:hypothetical protein